MSTQTPSLITEAIKCVLNYCIVLFPHFKGKLCINLFLEFVTYANSAMSHAGYGVCLWHSKSVRGKIMPKKSKINSELSRISNVL